MLATRVLDDYDCQQYVCRSVDTAKPPSNPYGTIIQRLEHGPSFTVLKHRRRPKFGDFWIVDRFWCGKKHSELFYNYYRTTTRPNLPSIR